MYNPKKITKINSWLYHLAVITNLILLCSCVTSSYNSSETTKSSTVRAIDRYTEIKVLEKDLLNSSESADAELLIEKSREFIKTQPFSIRVDEVYFILGTALLQYDRAPEAVEVLETFINDYPSSSSIGPSLLTLGIAYDTVGRHEKADEIYKKLVLDSKYSETKYAEGAQQLLETSLIDRRDALTDLTHAFNPENFVDKPVLDFQIENSKSQTVSLAQLRGHVVLLYFWATWSDRFIKEIPVINQTYTKYNNQQFQIIGIITDKKSEHIKDFIRENAIKGLHFHDKDGQIANMYRVRQIPTNFLIDTDGIVRKTNLKGGALPSAVAQLIEENARN